MTVRDLLDSRKNELIEADIVRFSGRTFPFDGHYKDSYRGWLGGVPHDAAWLDAPVLEAYGGDGRMSITYAACSCRNAVDKTEVTV